MSILEIYDTERLEMKCCIVEYGNIFLSIFGDFSNENFENTFWMNLTLNVILLCKTCWIIITRKLYTSFKIEKKRKIFD